MHNPKLKDVIQKLEKLRSDYIKKYGVEPTVWSMSEDDGETEVELCSGVKRKGCITSSNGNEMSARIKMGMF